MTRLDLLQGTLDLLVLRTLTNGARHGYQIAREIKQASNEVLQVEEGALYPALHRIEAKGWIEASWGVSENNRRAKYYRLTTTGQRRLGEETDNWAQVAVAITRVLEAT